MAYITQDRHHSESLASHSYEALVSIAGYVVTAFAAVVLFIPTVMLLAAVAMLEPEALEED